MQSVSEQDPVTVGLNQGQVPLAGWLPGVGWGSFWAGGQKAPQIKNKSSPPGWIKAAEWMEVSVTGAERGRRWVGAEQQGQSPHGLRLCAVLSQGPFVSRRDCGFGGGAMGSHFSFAGIDGETGLEKAKGGRPPTGDNQGREHGGLDRTE